MNASAQYTIKQLDIHDRKKKIGNYILGKSISEGAFSKIRHGLHILAREKVAVKIIPKKTMLQREHVKNSVQGEAMILQKLDHQNIVHLYEIMETKQSYYLVLELAEIGDFIKYLSYKKRLGERESQRYIRQIASALDHMHASNIVHRDLRLENLLLDKNNNIKITGFGCSDAFYRDTGLSTLCGSPAYVAPEMLCDRKCGPSVDIWSLGICMYAMLTGKLPFVPDPPDSLTSLQSLILRGAYIPDTLSDSCSNILSRILVVNVLERIQMDELLVHSFLLEHRVTPVITRQPPIDKLYPFVPKTEIVRYMTTVFNFQENDIFYSVTERKVNAVAATYHLLHKRFDAGLHLIGYSVKSQNRVKIRNDCYDSEASKSMNDKIQLPDLSSVHNTDTYVANASKSMFKSYVQLLKDSKLTSAHSFLTGNFSNKFKEKNFRHKTDGDILKYATNKEETANGFLSDFILTYSENEKLVQNSENFEWEQTFIFNKQEHTDTQTYLTDTQTHRHTDIFNTQESGSKPYLDEFKQNNQSYKINSKSKYENLEDDGRIGSVDITLYAPPTSSIIPSIPHLDTFAYCLAPYESQKEIELGKSTQVMPKQEAIANLKKADDPTKLKGNSANNINRNIEDPCRYESRNTFLKRGLKTGVNKKSNFSYGRLITNLNTEIEHAKVVGQGRRLIERARKSSRKIEDLGKVWSRNFRTSRSRRQLTDSEHSVGTEDSRAGGHDFFRAMDTDGALNIQDVVRQSQTFTYRPVITPKQTIVDGVTDVIRVHITSSTKY